MDSFKVGGALDSEDCLESKLLSMTDSSSEVENRKSRGREGKKKMKSRSIRLSRLSSLRSSTPQLKSSSTQSRSFLSGYAGNSELSTPVVTSDASPKSNYSQPTDATNRNFQASSHITDLFVVILFRC